MTIPLDVEKSERSAMPMRHASSADAQSTVSCDVVIVRFTRNVKLAFPSESAVPVRLVDRSQSSVACDPMDALEHCAVPTLAFGANPVPLTVIGCPSARSVAGSTVTTISAATGGAVATTRRAELPRIAAMTAAPALFMSHTPPGALYARSG